MMRSTYDDEKRDVTNYTSENYLHVNSCGVQSTHGEASRVIREKGRLDYHILYLVQGICQAYYDGNYHILEPGNYVIYEPGHRQEYLFEGNHNTLTFWLHFHGTGIPAALDDCQLSFGIHKAVRNSRAEDTFERLANSSYPANTQMKTYANGLLLQLLSELGVQRKDTQIPKPVSEALRFIHINYYLPLDINALASKCGLSRGRLMHVFKEVTGKTLLNYQLQFRLEKAKELLDIESLSISQVASMTGFEDALYFSRVFHKYVGTSPKNYRKGLRNGN